MSLSVKVGSFAAATATGNQAITGIGFQPKAVLFFAQAITADGASANAGRAVGCIAGGHQWAGAFISKDGGSTSRIDSRIDTDGCINFQNTDGTLRRKASYVSFDADGFTVNWGTITAQADLIAFMAIGGSDLSHANCGTFGQPTVTGVHAFTGIGFQPDCVMFWSPVNTAVAGAFAKATSGYFGAMTAQGQFYEGHRIASGSATPIVLSRLPTNAAVGQPNGTAGVFAEASYSSLDADGFSLNYSTVSASADLCAWLALGGGRYYIDSIVGLTVTGSQSITAPGFRPSGLLCATMCSGTFRPGDVSVSNARLTLGATDGASRFSKWLGIANGSVDSKQDYDSTKLIKMLHESSSAPVLDASVDLASFDGTGFTLNWLTNDGAFSWGVAYLAMGDAASLSQTVTETPAAAFWTPSVATPTGAITIAAAPATATWTAPAVVATSSIVLGPASAIATWTAPAVSSLTGPIALDVVSAAALWSLPDVDVLTGAIAADAAGAFSAWTVPAVLAIAAIVVSPDPATAGWTLPAIAFMQAFVASTTPAIALWRPGRALIVTGRQAVDIIAPANAPATDADDAPYATMTP